MNTKFKNSRGLFKKTMKIAAIAIFTLALIINVKITLTDPFVMMGEQVLAQTTTGTGTGTGTGTIPSYIVCYSESKVRVGWTYYDCGTCSKVMDEKGKGTPSKCFY